MSNNTYARHPLVPKIKAKLLQEAINLQLLYWDVLCEMAVEIRVVRKLQKQVLGLMSRGQAEIFVLLNVNYSSCTSRVGITWVSVPG